MKFRLGCFFLGAAMLLPNSIVGQVWVPIIPFGSNWKYLDNGSNQGTNWVGLNYNDSGWASGPGELGYGDGDEATVVSYGPSSGNKYITTYFRHAFTLTDPAAVTQLEAHLVRDDGAVVYLNGAEVWRDNMPAGNIGYLTVASSAVDSANESAILTQMIDPALLVAGTNVLAVEIHQQRSDSSDISFNLELVGLVVSGPPVILSSPQSQAVFAGSTVAFTVQAVGDPPLTYQWQFNGQDIANATNAILRLTNLTTNQAGAYQVWVSNGAGQALSDAADLTVLDTGSGMVDDFEPGIDLLQWLDFSDTVEANANGGSVSGNNSLWFGGDNQRYATTRPLNTTSGGTISFYIRLASGNGSPWEQVDLPGEAVVLEYSLDGGGNWTEMARYDSTSYYSWTYQFVVIPPEVSSAGTLFRWRQPSFSGDCCDHWALDDIMISVGPSAPEIIREPEDRLAVLGGSTVFSVVASGTRPFSYQWDFNGMDIDGATNDTLVVTGITPSQEGRYRVRISNALGGTASRKALLTIVQVEGESFRIASMTASNSLAIEHYELTGDDRGGIAISGTHLFYTGDEGTARFDLNNLNNADSLESILGQETRYDAMVSDLRTGTLYSLGNENSPITSSGGTINSLLELDGSTGALTGNHIALSMEIPFPDWWSSGIFSGFGRIVLHNGARVYDISLPSGIVTDLGPMPVPAHQSCENGAYWGVAEYFNGAVHLVFVQSQIRIVRVRVPDGMTTTVNTFLEGEALGEICCITISITQERWYFEHEYGSIFRPYQSPYPNETIGYADATFNYNQPSSPPVIAMEPQNRFGLAGRAVAVEGVIFGTEPLGYQWYFEGAPVPGAEGPVLNLSNASVDQSGGYQLVVTNPFGSVTSRVAQVVISEMRGTAGYYTDNYSPYYIGDFETPLLQAGYLPVEINNIASFDLSTVSLLILEQASGQPSPSLQSRFLDLQSWVDQGGKLIVDDPAFNYAEAASHPLILGSPQTLVLSDASRDINFIQVAGNPLANGPYGSLTDASLDNDFYGHGGYALGQTLPAGSTSLLSDGSDASRVVGFSYGLGGGFVYFSTIPLWVQLSDIGEKFEEFISVFTPNLVNYMDGLVPSGPATIGASPQDLTALEGLYARFNVVATGEAPLQYDWFFNGESISGASGSFLVLSNVSAAAVGEYQVVVSNPLGSATSAVARLTMVPGGNAFRIASLTTNGAQVVEHYDVTGYDRGGFAAGLTRVTYTGDGAPPDYIPTTAGFSLDNLSDSQTFPSVYYAVVSDLNSEILYALANGDVPLGNTGGTVTALLEIDDTTGALTGNRVDLSTPIPLSASYVYGNIGIFAGFDRIILHNGTRVFHVSLPSGQVVDLGFMSSPTHNYPGNWAYWGMAEYHEGDLYLVYVRDYRTIVRTRIPDGQSTIVASFSNLNDMATITASVRRNRWYFHHQYSSQFGDFNEAIGFAGATFEAILPPSPPLIRSQPSDRIAVLGSPITFRVVVTGTEPIHYQWSFNGQDIPGATNPTLLLSNVSFNDAGTYQVAVSNPLGSTNSAPFTVRVVEELTLGEALDAPYLDWTTGGTQPWFAQFAVTSDGEDAAQSGRISHNQETWIETTVQGPTPLSFRWKVSSESCCDYLEFFINGARQDYIRGEIDWRLMEYSLGPGPQTLRWRYRKDGSVNTGQDSGWVDQVDVAAGPIFSELGTKILWEDLPSFPPSVTNIAFTVVDDTTPGSNLVFSVTSTNTAVIPPENIFVSGSGTNFTITVIPLPNAFGNTLILLQATDLDGNVGSVELGISVRAINDPPSFTLATNLLVVADTAGLEVYPNWAENIRPGPPNESDQTVTFLVSNSASNLFTVQPTLNAGGTLTFITAPGLFGDAIVSVQLQDSGGRGFGGQDASPVQTFTIRIASANTPPAVQSDTFSALEDQPYSGLVTGSDLDGDPLTFHLLNAPALGMVVLNTNTGAFTYTPPANYNGSVNFTFAAHDGKASSLPGTVTLEIEPVNDAPTFTAGPDLTVLEDAGAQSRPNWASALNAGSADESGQSLQFQVSTEQPTLFAVLPAISPAGTLNFTPAENAHGTATLQVVLRDDGGTANGGVDASPAHILTVTVEPVNDAPSFVKGPNVTVQEDAGVQTLADWATAIQAGPANESEQTLLFELSVDQPALFAAGPTLSAAGTLTFQPAADQYGQANVTVVLRDNGGTEQGGVESSPPQSFSLTIQPVNDAPTFVIGPNLTVEEDAGSQTLANWATVIQPGPANESSQTVHFELSQDHSELFAAGPALSPAGTLTYTPAADQHGQVTVRVVLRDNGGAEHGGQDASAEQSVTITIQPVNDAPVAQAQSVQAEEDTEVIITLSGSDVDGDTLTYQIVDPPGHGVLTGRADQADWSYQPAADYSGPDQFRFRVSDGTLESEVAVVSITVEAVNDAPVAVVRVEPWDVVWPGQTRQLIIAPYADWTWVILDGSQSSDPEGDALEYLWMEEGTLLPFAVGSVVTNLFRVGTHQVVLLVDDGQDIGTAAAEFEVIPPALVLEEIILWIHQAGLPQNRKQPLIVSLKAAAASFERGNLHSALNQLEAVQNKIRAQVVREDPALAEKIQGALQTVIDAVMSRSQSMGDGL